MTPRDAEQRILAQEKRALDEWAKGNPLEYIEVYADEVTYFDDMGAHRRVDGREAMTRYFKSLTIPAHRYELERTHVQVHGDVGILSLIYQPYGLDGSKQKPWRATSVYRRINGDWLIVHAQWSLVKQEAPAEP